MKGFVPHIISLLFIATVSISAVAAPLFSSEIVRSKESVELKASKKSRITAEIPFGNIFIEKSSDRILTISLEKSIKSSNRDKSLKILEKVNISYSESRKHIKITVKKNRYLKKLNSIDLYLTIPAKHELELYTGGGSVRIDDYSGTVSVKTAGGSIICGNITDGSVEASTSGGNITIGNVTNGSLTSETRGGDINCGDIREKAELKTSGGNISAGNIEDDLRADTSGGNISISGCRRNADLATKGGNISAGIFKGRLKAETKGGNIEIDECTEDTVLLTYGGDISVKEILGSIKAETYGGELTAALGKHCSDKSDISLSSKGGDITVKIPADFSFKLDAEIKISKKNNMKVSIISDFAEKNIYNDSDKSKKISSSGVFNGGSSKIQLSTKDSSIYISRY